MKNRRLRIADARAFGISVRTYQRWTKGDIMKPDGRPEAERPKPANSLTQKEKDRILDTCHQPEYASLPPGQIVPDPADRGEYIASESSFYRVLHEADEQHHRGRSRKPVSSPPPKGWCATGPNQVWSWDITWLPSVIVGMFFYLYMTMDIYSRKIVGWEVHPVESAKNSTAIAPSSTSPRPSGTTGMMRGSSVGVTRCIWRPGSGTPPAGAEPHETGSQWRMSG